MADFETTFTGFASATVVTYGSSVPDAAYVYFYQVVNSNPETTGSELALTTLSIPAVGVTSAGYVDGWVFKDGSSNEFVGSEIDGLGSGMDPSVAQDPPGAPDPAAVTVTYDTTSDSTVTFSFLDLNAYTPLIWFTSNNGPGSVLATLNTAGTLHTQNLVASAVPVPASLILVLSGLPMALGFGTVWRRRQQLPVIS